MSSASLGILVKSLLSSWSASMFVLSIATCISFSSRSSLAQFSLCSCNVSLILSESVFDTGALTFAEDVQLNVVCRLRHPRPASMPLL